MRRILLIDDDVELCELLVEYLKSEGLDTVTVNDAYVGLEHALKGDFDMVILDVMITGIDGLEILNQIRAGSDRPVLMLTTRGDVAGRMVGLQTGADDYLAKPFNPRDLLARIRAIL